MANPSPNQPKAKEFYNSKWLWATIAVISLALTGHYLFGSRSGESSSSEPPSLIKSDPDVIRVRLEPGQWSRDIKVDWDRYDIHWDTPDAWINLWFEKDLEPVRLLYGDPVKLGARGYGFRAYSERGGELLCIRLGSNRSYR